MNEEQYLFNNIYLDLNAKALDQEFDLKDIMI